MNMNQVVPSMNRLSVEDVNNIITVDPPGGQLNVHQILILESSPTVRMIRMKTWEQD